MSQTSHDHNAGSSNHGTCNKVAGKNILRYSAEEMIDLFTYYPYPPEQLLPFCEIISPLGSQKPATTTPFSDLEERSYFKGVNSYLALLEKYPQFRSRGRGRGRPRGRPNRSFDHWDKRSNGSVPNGVGPPGQWDQSWMTCGGQRQRWHSGASNASEPVYHSQGRRSDWVPVRGGVWTRGGGGGGRGGRRGNGSSGHGDRNGDGHMRVPQDCQNRTDGGVSPNYGGSQSSVGHEVEEIWEEDDWDFDLIGDTPVSECDFHDHDEEWSRILSHASLYDLREHAGGGADSPAAWSEGPAPSASPPRSLCLDPPVLQRLVRKELLRSPSQGSINPEILQEMVENVITQLPVIAQDGGISPLTPSQAMELTEANKRLEEELRHRDSLLMEHQNRLRMKEEELEVERRKHLRAWDHGPPHRRNRPKSLAEIQWEQAAEEGLPVACYRPVTWAEKISSAASNSCLNAKGEINGSRGQLADSLLFNNKSRPLTRHFSLDVLHNREEAPEQDHAGWVARKGRRRRVFRRVDLNNVNSLVTPSPH